ncbi:MAG: hypothetical protein ABWZ53_01640 [Actinomycetota bacterium]
MRRRQIREEKPRPKRRRRHDDDGGPAPSPVAVPSSAHGRELLTRLRVERDTIDQALDLLVCDARGRPSDA